MSLISSLIESYEFNRTRTDTVIKRVEDLGGSEVLGWRPGPGRAHVAWQLMHIGVTEEIFATERFRPEKPAEFSDLWSRFRGGSTPDDDIPTLDSIRQILSKTRDSLLDTLSQITEAELETVPKALEERGLTVRTALKILSWHESHHQGQAHLTLNLFEAQ